MHWWLKREIVDCVPLTYRINPTPYLALHHQL